MKVISEEEHSTAYSIGITILAIQWSTSIVIWNTPEGE